MDSLKVNSGSMSSLVSDQASNESLIDSLQLEDTEIDEILSSLKLDEIQNEIVENLSVQDVLNSIDALESDRESNLEDFLNFNQLQQPKHIHSILRQYSFQGISAQIASASDRIGAGYASAVVYSRMICVGTSHSVILGFDQSQTLRWCCLEGQNKEQGAVASLSLNFDSTRLLAGFARGLIIMIDTKNGDILRHLDVITPNSGVLCVKWSRATLALALDTGGSVWSLSFTRRLGVRGCDSRCLFSGARGEVTTLEPLVFNEDEIHSLRNYNLVALSTLSKFFIIQIRPRLKVIKYHMLYGSNDSLPLLSWQMVLIQSADSSRSVDPVLASGRGTNIYFHQVTYINGRIVTLFLRHVTLSYNALALHWLGPKTIACIDTTETLHLLDVRTNQELESVDISRFGIVYSSSLFKGLATGSNVSPALSLAGTYSCYNTVISHESQLYILGKRNLYGINARSFNDRLSYLTTKQNWIEAFQLSVTSFNASLERPKRNELVRERILQLFQDYLQATSRAPELHLNIVMKCLIEIKETELLWGELWERLNNQDLYLNLITQHIESDTLKFISPIVSQALIEYWSNTSKEENHLMRLEAIILKLDWRCLDLHQALTVSKKEHLFKAQIHLNSKALGDYTISIIELLPLINSLEYNESRALGNNLLVYISSCLAGRSYPSGEIEPNSVTSVKYDILRILTVTHSMNADDNQKPYPYLRLLLHFDTRETLNVLSLAFQEKEFGSDLGLSQRQRIINILIEIMSTDEEDWSQQFGILCNFISQQISSLPDSKSFLGKIIKYLKNEEEELSDSQTSQNYYRKHLEKEQTFLNMLESNILNDYYTYDELLEMASNARCFQAAQYILEKLKRYDDIMRCFLMDNSRQTEIFNYILEHKSNDERKIYHQLVEHFESLLDIDASKITNILVEYYPICIPNMIKQLQSNENTKLLYLFLKNLVDLGFQMEPDLYDTFLELLCQYNSEGVLEFLENSSLYDTEKALKVTEKFNMTTSMIYLYEKKNDYRKAFDLSIELLKEAPESVAENYGLQVSSLCFRASNKLDKDERELLWFELIKIILTRADLNSIVKNVLLVSGNFVDLTKLVQLIMDICDGTKNFGDIKHILTGMLTNFEYESLLLQTTSKILERDLHGILSKSKQSSGNGIFVKSIKCTYCNSKLFHSALDTEVEDDQIIVFSICGHSCHNSCFQKEKKQINDNEDDNNIINEDVLRCNQCKKVIPYESDSIYLEEIYLTPPNDFVSKELNIRAPNRKGIDN